MTRAACEPCQTLADRWLDTRPQDLHRGLGYITQASAARDLTPAGVAERRRSRVDRWASLVREQRAAITADCRRLHGAAA